MNRFTDMAIQNYARRLTAVVLDLVKPEVGPFDPPSPKEQIYCGGKYRHTKR